MESFLLNRSLGTIRPSTFERAQTTRLIHALQPAAANAVIFDGSPDTPAHSQLDTLDRSTQERSTTDASNTSDDAVAQPESTDSAPRAPVSLARRRAALASAARSRAGGETVPSLRDDQGGGRRRPVSRTLETSPCARKPRPEVATLAWRTGNVEMYSGHTDGTIKAWIPRTREEAERDEEEAAEAQAASLDGGSERKRKGQVLEDVYRDLTRQKITFGLQ
ncbi:MAG: hypothetical protein M1815_006272 [Lichina confinis]|nr:MAG: hypothetical protein M1815_006272 [Lichina confinis]